MAEPLRITSKQIEILDEPPCCLEFCPTQPEYFVVGTYNLLQSQETAQEDVKAQQTRIGSLLVFKLSNESIKCVQVLKTSYAILDIHFNRFDKDLLGVATSTGCIALYRFSWTADGSSTPLRFTQVYQLFDEQTIVTVLRWSPDSSTEAAVTLSTGEVFRLNLEDHAQHSSDPEYTHGLEAWTVMYTPPDWSYSALISGGDDAVLRYAPMNLASRTFDVGKSPNGFTNSRIHSAGVTAILPLTEGIIATGSYDDHFRILRLPKRPSQRPEVLLELNLGGGVWRLNSIGSEGNDVGGIYKNTMLVSGMYAGAFLLDVARSQDGQWSAEIRAQFTEHESMNYACAVQPRLADSEENTKRLVVSCSFYDKKLCLWQIP